MQIKTMSAPTSRFRPSVTAAAPGKLILSGEHAVLKGAPALAVAINHYAITRVSPKRPHEIFIDLINLSHRRRRTLETLKKLRERLHEDYNQFRAGNLGIRQVIKKPFELVEYTTTHFIDKLEKYCHDGIHLQHHSDIPTGCGMGSSAATIVSTNYALDQYFQRHLSLDQLYQISHQSENLQHGKASGLDLYLSIHGGVVYYDQAQFTKLTQPTHPLYWVNTGKPLSSTGECVCLSLQKLEQQPALIERFAQTVQQFKNALQQAQPNHLITAMRQNQRLLTQLGVVPLAIHRFVDDIEAVDGAAKVSGAGAISGDNAGIVLLSGDEQHLTQITKAHGFTLNPLIIDKQGVQLR